MIKNILFSCVFIFSSCLVYADIKPGFSKEEYLEILRLCRAVDTTKSIYDLTPPPEKFTNIYHKDGLGLKNAWGLFVDGDNNHAIVLRGTIPKLNSWLENFYAAMVPATGSIKLENDFIFNYKLSDNLQAKVHVGWLIGMAYLQRDILPKLDSLAKENKFNIYIAGHSQGGALTYLLSSHLYYLQKQGLVNPNFRFKVITSAAPKPGDLYYAQDFEYIFRNGWSYSVINSTDWVPETPFSIQTFTDFNPNNPFKTIQKTLNKQKLVVKLYGKRIYNQLNKTTRKAQQKMELYLGKVISKYIKSALPEYESPGYQNSSSYVRTGFPIILKGTNQDLEESNNAFMKHMYWAYYQLMQDYN